MTEDNRFVYRLEKVIGSGDVPEMLMLTLNDEHEVDEEITLQNSDVKWRVLTKEPISVLENKGRFSDE